MDSIFLVLQFILAVVLTIAILLQKSSSIGLGAYSGSNESLFGAKGPAGFLAKFTFIVGVIFILNTLMLGYTYNTQTQNSLLDSIDTNSIVPNAAGGNDTTPVAPSAPMAPESKQ
ncbi:MAG: preprotein translocase subunit SecG [Campylobacter sp.]